MLVDPNFVIFGSFFLLYYCELQELTTHLGQDSKKIHLHVCTEMQDIIQLLWKGLRGIVSSPPDVMNTEIHQVLPGAL